MIANRKQRKQAMMCHAADISDLLTKETYGPTLRALEINTIVFTLETGQEIKGLIEKIYQKWDDVVSVSLTPGKGIRTLVIDFNCECPEHQGS